MKKRSLLPQLLVSLSLALLLLSCSKDNSNTDNNNNNNSNNPPSSSTTVNIAGMAFDPASLTVKAGTTVTWKNNDSMPHTVTADDGSFDSGSIKTGGSYTHTFSIAGTVNYHCSIHPSMKAAVVVN